MEDCLELSEWRYNAKRQHVAVFGALWEAG
jgi:hypothetical protein